MHDCLCGSALPGAKTAARSRPEGRSRNLVFLALLLVAVISSAADDSQIIAPSSSTRDAFGQFANFLETLQKNYVDPTRIQPSVHTREALRAFARSLDPEANYLTADEVMAAKAPPDKDTGDIGLTLAIRDGFPTVVSPLDGSPAQTAGLLGGEQLVALNGKPTAQAPLPEIVNQLRGPLGSRVVLTLFDPNANTTRALAIERTAPSPPTPAKLKFLANGVAYVRLSDFSFASVELFLAQIRRAEEQRAHALILDLRNNPGGTIDAMVVAARSFVPARTGIVTLEHADVKRSVIFGSDEGKKFTTPVAILVNGGTAAEAEIFAAALRDKTRVRLVGSKTFGRGRHVASFALPDGSMLVLPTATFMPPSKISFHAIGLSPDVPVEFTRAAERKLATAGFGAFDWVNDKTQLLAADLPLARALELLAK